MLRQYVDTKQSNWDEFLPLCALTYNSTKHISSGYTPNMLMFGREFHLPLELVLPRPDAVADELEDHDNIDSFVNRQSHAIVVVHDLARKNLQQAVAIQKSYHDCKSSTRTLKVGMSVWLYNPRRVTRQSMGGSLCCHCLVRKSLG